MTMNLPELSAVPIDQGTRHPAAALFGDAFDWDVVILVSGGPDPLAVAEEIARRCNQAKEA